MKKTFVISLILTFIVLFFSSYTFFRWYEYKNAYTETRVYMTELQSWEEKKAELLQELQLLKEGTK